MVYFPFGRSLVCTRTENGALASVFSSGLGPSSTNTAKTPLAASTGPGRGIMPLTWPRSPDQPAAEVGLTAGVPVDDCDGSEVPVPAGLVCESTDVVRAACDEDESCRKV